LRREEVRGRGSSSGFQVSGFGFWGFELRISTLTGQKVCSLIFNHLRILIRLWRGKKSCGNFRELPGRSSTVRRSNLPVGTRRIGSHRRRHWTQQSPPFPGFSAFGVAAALMFGRAVGAVEKPRRAVPARHLWCKGAFKALTTRFIMRPLSHAG